MLSQAVSLLNLFYGKFFFLFFVTAISLAVRKSMKDTNRLSPLLLFYISGVSRGYDSLLFDVGRLFREYSPSGGASVRLGPKTLRT